MKEHSTKQAILEAALDLFSVCGYDGVSVKDIANAVGIKDGSLYKHYKSKQDIFETLIVEMNRRFEETVIFYKLPQGEIGEVYRQYGENDVEWLKKTAEAIFLFFFDDPYAGKFRRLLMLEQYKNNEAARLFNEWFLDGALSFQAALFERLMQEGYFRRADPFVTATQFYGPVLLLLLRYDAMPEKRDEALALLRLHVEEFAANYHISHGGQNESE